MSLNVSGTRVSKTLLAQVAVRNINQNMQQMLELQSQMASGLRLYKPSIDPASAAVTLSFQHILERRGQAVANISRSNEFLSSSDTALSDLQDLLNEATEIASTNIGAGADDAARQNAATVVGSLISQLAQIGNRQYNGRYLFGGLIRCTPACIPAARPRSRPARPCPAPSACDCLKSNSHDPSRATPWPEELAVGETEVQAALGDLHPQQLRQLAIEVA